MLLNTSLVSWLSTLDMEEEIELSSVSTMDIKVREGRNEERIEALALLLRENILFLPPFTDVLLTPLPPADSPPCPL